jgi:hypothetical protein
VVRKQRNHSEITAEHNVLDGEVDIQVLGLEEVHSSKCLKSAKVSFRGLGLSADEGGRHLLQNEEQTE